MDTVSQFSSDTHYWGEEEKITLPIFATINIWSTIMVSIDYSVSEEPGARDRLHRRASPGAYRKPGSLSGAVQRF